MKIALVGHQGCGRSALYRALSGNSEADTAKPLTVCVPDPRIDFLQQHWAPRSVVHATVTFTDVPSPAFSPKNMGRIKEATALALVLDNYALGNIEEAFGDCESELLLSDFGIAEKRVARLRKESRGKSAEAMLLISALESRGRRRSGSPSVSNQRSASPPASHASCALSSMGGSDSNHAAASAMNTRAGCGGHSARSRLLASVATA